VRKFSLELLVAGVGVILLASPGYSASRRNLPGFSTSNIPASDDGVAGPVNLGFTINVFGTNYSAVYISNNGNVTFGGPIAGPVSAFTPFGLANAGIKMFAPFFADVDTRGAGSGIVTYGTDTVNGRPAFGVEWPHVGYYNQQTNKLNSFELVIVDRSDVMAGAFDLEFNYDAIQWETGGASGGANGLGGFSARVGYTNGITGAGGVTFEIPGSGASTPGAPVLGTFVDGGPNALVTNSLNTAVVGRYLWAVRGGSPGPPPAPPVSPVGAPATTTPLLILSGMMLIGIVTYMKTRTA
jgi:Nidogen-like